jgi:deoxyadenosine/deoxycytidine kinase
VAYNRMRSRNRPEEETIPLSYIKLVHQYYETWLVERKMGPLSAPVLIINADESKDNLLEVYEKNQSQVLGLNL